MDIYHYDDSGVYRGTTKAKPDPKELGRWLIPRNATTIAPPPVGDDKVAVFSGVSWFVTEDHRGKKIYNDDNRYGLLIGTLGQIPEGYVTVPPTSEFDELINGQWVRDEQAETLHWRSVTSCGPLQFRRALRASGLMDLVKDYLETADEEVIEAWEYATKIDRDDPFILAVQQLLNKTDEEVDNLFKLALTFP